MLNCSVAKDNDVSKKTNQSNQIEVTLQLESIVVNKSVKDKIYIEITEYSNINQPKEYRIPTYPKHWLMQDLAKLKNTILWHNLIQQSENKELVVSLVENDFPPLDSDKPLGSIKLLLGNKNNKLDITWDKAGFKEAIQIEKIFDKKLPNHVIFKLKNKHSEYIINLTVTVQPMPST